MYVCLSQGNMRFVFKSAFDALLQSIISISENHCFNKVFKIIIWFWRHEIIRILHAMLFPSFILNDLFHAKQKKTRDVNWWKILLCVHSFSDKTLIFKYARKWRTQSAIHLSQLWILISCSSIVKLHKMAKLFALFIQINATLTCSLFVEWVNL